MMLERSKSEDEDQVPENDLEEKLLPQNDQQQVDQNVVEPPPLDQIVLPLLEDERVKNEIDNIEVPKTQEEEELEELMKQDAMLSEPQTLPPVVAPSQVYDSAPQTLALPEVKVYERAVVEYPSLSRAPDYLPDEFKNLRYQPPPIPAQVVD